MLIHGDDHHASVETLVRTSVQDGVGTVIMGNPTGGNLLSLDMMMLINNALLDLSEDPAVRVLVITGTDDVFSHGEDVTEIRANDREDRIGRILYETSRLLTTMVAIRQPVMVAVNGPAFGTGCAMACVADMSLAADTATFAIPSIHYGVFSITGAVALTRVMSHKRAMELLLTGDTIDAQTAVAYGMVNRTVPAASLAAEIQTLAARIAQAPLSVLKNGKNYFQQQLDMSIQSGFDFASQTMIQSLLSTDAMDGMDAWLKSQNSAQ